MNPTLGKRHLRLAHNTEFTRKMHPETLRNSNDTTWARFDERTAEALDATDGISGDDLARIAAFEPAGPNLKPIGEQHGIWSDVRRATEAVAA